MITCNKCGYKVPEGAFNCPRCGSPLSTRMEGGPGSRTGGQDQAEIPAWLETLRVGERPAAPANNSTNFSAADLLEDGSLPSWMRSGRAQSSVSDAFNALHPVSGPSPLTDQGSISQKGLDAQSLIDEKSLPSWMREGSSPSTPSNGFEASSLIDSAALPDWMRSLQPPQSSPSAPQSAQPAPDAAAPDWMRSLQPPQSSPVLPQSAQPAPDAAAPDWMRSLQPSQPSSFDSQPSSSAMPASEPLAPSSKGFSARDLLDEQSLPSWMGQQNGQAASPNNGQPVQPGLLSPSSLIDQNALPSWMAQQSGQMAQQNGQTATPSSPSNGQNPVQSGLLSPSSLIDQNALPSWMAQQSGQAATPSSPKNGQSVQPGLLSPSSLIDQNALPAWMQEGGNASSPAPSAPLQSSPLWQAPGSPAQPPTQNPLAQNAAMPNGNLAASSFVDANSLPDWLRSGAGQPSAGMQPQPSANMPLQPDPSRSGAYSGPPRVENMRVPSRPRGEANANDGSEVAANVFASVLGVASSAPQLPPSSPAQAPYGQQQPNPYSPSQSSPQNPPMGMPGQMPAYNNAPGMAQQGQMPNAGAPAMNQPGFASGSYGVGNLANRSSLGVPSPGAIPPQPYNAASSMPNASAQADDQKSSKKRGLVDTLLGWLLH